MKLILNGEPTGVPHDTTVSELIDICGLERQRVAVEVNGDIVARATFDDVRLHDGDKVEIVHFVGGG